MSESPQGDMPDDWNDPGRAIFYRSRATHVGLILLCIAACEAALFYYQPGGWSTARIIVGGILAGIWCYMSIFINWILVADW